VDVVQESRAREGLAELFGHWEQMLRIRIFEQHVLRLAAEGAALGAIHPCTGQEAIAAGVLGERLPDEWVVSYYRCHGHALACGCAEVAVLREILARSDGLCGGNGGSMHLADRSRHFLGATSIVAAQLPIAAGVAMSVQADQEPRAVVVFCGDGALGAGAAYEAITIAHRKRLPLLVVCEDNGWQDHTRSADVRSLEPADLLAGLGLPTEEVDGNDVTAVARVARRSLAECRAGRGPRALVARTYLRDFHAQFGVTPPAEYRPAEQVRHWLARDPLDLAATRLSRAGHDLAARQAEIEAELSLVVTALLGERA
jgi:pyruvate dehydrogenase E1 component alpha subunit/2-oxoisovalerate dehydrogenase E1 component